MKRVKELMVKSGIKHVVDEPLITVAKMMIAEDLDYLPIFKNHNLSHFSDCIGSINWPGLYKAVNEGNNNDCSIAQLPGKYWAKPFPSIPEDETIYQASLKLQETKYALLAIDGAGIIKGIINAYDLAREIASPVHVAIEDIFDIERRLKMILIKKYKGLPQKTILDSTWGDLLQRGKDCSDYEVQRFFRQNKIDIVEFKRIRDRLFHPTPINEDLVLYGQISELHNRWKRLSQTLLDDFSV